MRAAERLAPVLEAFVAGPLPVRIRCWDGSEAGPSAAGGTVVFRRRRALRHLVWSPDELGLALPRRGVRVGHAAPARRP